MAVDNIERSLMLFFCHKLWQHESMKEVLYTCTIYCNICINLIYYIHRASSILLIIFYY